jgi:hypothetical protein
MSWHATAYIKKLTLNADGSPLTAREKLLLFVLADYHHEERNCCWAGLTAIATDALTSRRHLLRLLRDLEAKGTIEIERRGQNSNLYKFPGLPRDAMSLPRDKKSRGRDMAASPPRDIAMSPEPLMNLQLEPSRDSTHIETVKARIKEAERGAKQRFVRGYVENQRKRKSSA